MARSHVQEAKWHVGPKTRRPNEMARRELLALANALALATTFGARQAGGEARGPEDARATKQYAHKALSSIAGNENCFMFVRI